MRERQQDKNNNNNNTKKRRNTTTTTTTTWCKSSSFLLLLLFLFSCPCLLLADTKFYRTYCDIGQQPIEIAQWDSELHGYYIIDDTTTATSAPITTTNNPDQGQRKRKRSKLIQIMDGSSNAEKEEKEKRQQNVQKEEDDNDDDEEEDIRFVYPTMANKIKHYLRSSSKTMTNMDIVNNIIKKGEETQQQQQNRQLQQFLPEGIDGIEIIPALSVQVRSCACLNKLASREGTRGETTATTGRGNYNRRLQLPYQDSNVLRNNKEHPYDYYCPASTNHCAIPDGRVLYRWNQQTEWDERFHPGCTTIKRRTGFARSIWPVLMVWYGSVVMFMLSTGNGRSALGFCFARCVPGWNTFFVNRIQRVDPDRANHMILNHYRMVQSHHLDQIATLFETAPSIFVPARNNHDNLNANNASSDDDDNDDDNDNDNDNELRRRIRNRRRKQPTCLDLKTKKHKTITDVVAYSATITIVPSSPTTSKNENENDNIRLANTCTICQVEIEDGERVGNLPCNHLFHVDCLKLWLTRRNVCPLCLQQDVASPHHRNDDSDNDNNDNNAEEQEQDSNVEEQEIEFVSEQERNHQDQGQVVQEEVRGEHRRRNRVHERDNETEQAV